jgi:lipoprotein-anchoring transpeptidase ErfK/SrfK
VLHRAPPPAQPATAAYTIKRILSIAGLLRYGEWHWDAAGVPASAPIVVTIDLADHVLSVCRGGYEIGTTSVIYGADGKPTPLGVFPITQKDSRHRSSLSGGAPMPYMLRLTDDGVPIHGSEVGADLMTMAASACRSPSRGHRSAR